MLVWRPQSGRTALHLAAVRGHADLAAWLYHDLSLQASTANTDGMTAVHFAGLGGKVEIAEMFYGKEPEAFFIVSKVWLENACAAAYVVCGSLLGGSCRTG